MDMGAYVVVLNAEKVTVSGTKFDDKTYFNHVNGRPGHYRVEAFKDLQKVSPWDSWTACTFHALFEAQLARSGWCEWRLFSFKKHVDIGVSTPYFALSKPTCVHTDAPNVVMHATARHAPTHAAQCTVGCVVGMA